MLTVSFLRRSKSVRRCIGYAREVSIESGSYEGELWHAIAGQQELAEQLVFAEAAVNDYCLVFGTQPDGKTWTFGSRLSSG